MNNADKLNDDRSDIDIESIDDESNKDISKLFFKSILR